MKTVFEIPVDYDENPALKTEEDFPKVKAEIEERNSIDPYVVRELEQKKCLWYDYDQDKTDTSDSTGQKTDKGIRDGSHDEPKSETLNSIDLDIDQDAIPPESMKSMTGFNTEQNSVTESYNGKSSDLIRNYSAPPKLGKYIRSKPSMQRDPSLAWDGFVKEYDNEYDDSEYFKEHDVSSLPFDSIREYSMEEENPLNDIPEPYQDETPNETDFLGTPLSSTNRSVSKEFLQITPDLDGMSSDEEEEIEYEKLLDPDYKEFMKYWEEKRKPFETRTFDEVVKQKPLSTKNRDFKVSLLDNEPPIRLTNLSVDEVVMTDEKPEKKPKHIKRPKKVKEFRIRPEKYSYTTHISDAFAWLFKDESSKKTLKATDRNSKSLDLNEFDIINSNDKDNVTPNVSFRDLPVDTVKKESTPDNKNETLEKASNVVNTSAKLESHDNSMNSSIVATEAEPSESEHVITNLIYSRTRRKKFKQKTEDYTIISIDHGTEPIENKIVTRKSPDGERKITSPDSEKNVDFRATLFASKSTGKEIKKVDITNESSDDDMLLFQSPYKGSRKGKSQTKKRSDSNELSLVNSFNTIFKEEKEVNDNDLNIDSTKDLRECNLTKDQNKPKEGIDNKGQESLTKRSASIKLDLTAKESADILNKLSQKDSKIQGEPNLVVESHVQRNENKFSNNTDIENNVQIPHKTPNPTEITENTNITSSKIEARNGHGPNNPPDMLPDVSSFVVVQLDKPEDKAIIKNLNEEKPKASTEIQQTDSKSWGVANDPLQVKNDPDVAINENNANKTAELDSNIQLPAVTTEEIEINVSTNETLSKTEVTNGNLNDNTSEIVENKNIALSKNETRNGQAPNIPPDMLPDVSSFVVVQLDKPEGKTITENLDEEQKPKTSEVQKTNSKLCGVATDLLQVKDDPDVAFIEDNVNNTIELDINNQLPAVTTEQTEMNVVSTKNSLSKTEATSDNVNDNTSVTLPNVSSYVVIKSETHDDKATIKAQDKEKSGPKESEVEPTDKNDIKHKKNDCILNAQNAEGQINNNDHSKKSSVFKAPETKKSNQVTPSPNVSLQISSSNTNNQIDKPPISHITDQQNQQNENRKNEDEDNSKNEDKNSGKVIPVSKDLLKPTIMTPLILPRFLRRYSSFFN